ncbi:MAG: glycosyltransferase, partial [Maribacter sp.]
MSIFNKTIVQINVEANFGSTGKISENLNGYLVEHKNVGYIAHGPIKRESPSNTIAIGDRQDYYMHILRTRIFDQHGLGSQSATDAFLKKLKALRPDLIHLHNIHGYYINYELLFQFLKNSKVPIVWTLHDCWAFTGHCTHFEYVGCEKWKTECHTCPLTHTYPKSWYRDRSTKNFNQKKKAFTSVPNMTLVPVSGWLASKLKDSFLKQYPVSTITNGIDVQAFKPLNASANPLTDKFKAFSVILGVA